MKDTLYFIFALLCGWVLNAYERHMGNLEFAVIRRPLLSLVAAWLVGAILMTWILT